jgi:cardiolipin synthase
VRVRLLLAERSDVTIAQFAGRRLYEQFLRAGVEIYEYRPQVLHAKLILIDDVAYAGSCNLDLRSLKFNYELMVRLQDPAVSAQARKRFEEDRARATRIDPAEWRHRRGLWTKLREELCYFLLARIDPWVVRWQLRILR